MELSQLSIEMLLRARKEGISLTLAKQKDKQGSKGETYSYSMRKLWGELPIHTGSLLLTLKTLKEELVNTSIVNTDSIRILSADTRITETNKRKKDYSIRKHQ